MEKLKTILSFVFQLFAAFLIVYIILVFVSAKAASYSGATESPQSVFLRQKVPSEPQKDALRGVHALIKQYNWHIPTILRIMECESHFNPRAHNYNPRTGDDSYGLMQINMLGKMGESRRARFNITNKDLFDPAINIEVAYKIYLDQGYSAWSCY